MDFKELFKNKKPVIGMIHLAGLIKNKQAIKELLIYEKCKIDGVILENYHGETKDVYKLINAIEHCNYNLIFGVNILGDFKESFEITKNYKFIKFIQMDAISGRYENSSINYSEYSIIKNASNALVMGGVWPKYYAPFKYSILEDDLIEAKSRCEAIVVTGQGTGKETPVEKIIKFRETIGDFPLIIGAGINDKNAIEQLSIADACIAGSYFKDNNTYEIVREEKVKNLMKIINDNF